MNRMISVQLEKVRLHILFLPLCLCSDLNRPISSGDRLPYPQHTATPSDTMEETSFVAKHILFYGQNTWLTEGTNKELTYTHKHTS